MAENHYVDSKDQHIAAEGAPTHTELVGMYREAKKEVLSPWMQEDDRQAAMQKERDGVITDLRKSSLRIGFYLGLPAALSIVLGTLALFRTGKDVNEADAMVLAFVLLFALAGWAIMSFALIKATGTIFRKHTLRPLPIILTILLSLVFLIFPALRYFDKTIGGFAGNTAALVSILVLGIIISTILIFIWTAKHIPGLAKILALLVIFGASVATSYLM
jgi:hypothetical protein